PVPDADLKTWLQPLVVPDDVYRFAMSSDGQLLAVASASELSLYQLGANEPLFPPTKLSTPPEDLKFSADAHWLACSTQNTLRLMNTITGAAEPEFPVNAFRIEFLGTTDHLITIPQLPGAPLVLIDPHNGKDCGSPFGQPQFNAHSHGALLFSLRDLPSYLPTTLRLLDPATGQPLCEPFIHDGPISIARLSLDGT